MAEYEDWIRDDVVCNQNDKWQVMIHNFQGHQRIMIILIELIRKPHLSQKDGPEEEGQEDLGNKRHLEENSVPLPCLEKAVLVFPVHEVFWWLFCREEAET